MEPLACTELSMLPIEPRISAELVAKLFGYNPVTGALYRKESRGNAKAGSLVTGDYVKVNGWTYVTARVIWCIYYGEWPPLDRLVDHKDRNHSNNRSDNLRLATYAQNSQNKAGYGQLAKGVYWRNRESCFAARIIANGKIIELGSFQTEEEASTIYRQACLKYHGEFACLE